MFALFDYCSLMQVAKVIIPKRSQTIGILLSSLRLEMSEIEDGE